VAQNGASKALKSRLAGVKSPLELLDMEQVAVGSSLGSSAESIADFLQQIVDILNKNDIEVSDFNPFSKRQSLGLRTLLCALVVIDRLFETLPDFHLTPSNLHSTVTLCMMLVSKFSEDEPFNNKFWSTVAGLPLKKVNRCELTLVQVLKYRFRVSDETYFAFLKRIEMM
jgi:hypothetical protein